MRTLSFLLVSIILLAGPLSLAVEIPSQILDGDLASKFQDTSDFASEDGNDVIRAYFRIAQSSLPNRDTLLAQIKLQLVKNERFAAYLTGRIDAIPHAYESFSERATVFDMMGEIPAAWSLRKLGSWLNCPPMTVSQETLDITDIDYSSNIGNHVLAAWGLEKLATGNSRILMVSLDDKRIPRWREWWRLNENNVDAYATELQNAIRAKLPQAKEATKTVAPKTAAVTGAQEKALLEPQPPNNKLIWWVSIILSIGFILFLGRVFFRRRS